LGFFAIMSSQPSSLIVISPEASSNSAPDRSTKLAKRPYFCFKSPNLDCSWSLLSLSPAASLYAAVTSFQAAAFSDFPSPQCFVVAAENAVSMCFSLAGFQLAVCLVSLAFFVICIVIILLLLLLLILLCSNKSDQGYDNE